MPDDDRVDRHHGDNSLKFFSAMIVDRPYLAPWTAQGPAAAGASSTRAPEGTAAAMKLTLDLHDIYNRGGDIDRALNAVIQEAVAKRAPLVEIIPGKGSGALKKHVLRFLDQKEIKHLYHRVEKDSKNFGRIFVHFRWK